MLVSVNTWFKIISAWKQQEVRTLSLHPAPRLCRRGLDGVNLQHVEGETEGGWEQHYIPKVSWTTTDCSMVALMWRKFRTSILLHLYKIDRWIKSGLSFKTFGTDCHVILQLIDYVTISFTKSFYHAVKALQCQYYLYFHIQLNKLRLTASWFKHCLMVNILGMSSVKFLLFLNLNNN